MSELSVSNDDLFDLLYLSKNFFDRPILVARRNAGPRNLAPARGNRSMHIDKFLVSIDMRNFDPEDITVKASDGYIIIEGKHEGMDKHGYISRHYKRRFTLPEGCNPETVESRLSSDGVLIVKAPNVKDRAVPIMQTGPVRRKAQDEDVYGEAEEVKSSQIKRRRYFC